MGKSTSRSSSVKACNRIRRNGRCSRIRRGQPNAELNASGEIERLSRNTNQDFLSLFWASTALPVASHHSLDSLDQTALRPTRSPRLVARAGRSRWTPRSALRARHQSRGGLDGQGRVSAKSLSIEQDRTDNVLDLVDYRQDTCELGL